MVTHELITEVYRWISIVGCNDCAVEGGNFWSDLGSDNQAYLVQALKFRYATLITKNAFQEIHYTT